jgi:hypothetical protein
MSDHRVNVVIQSHLRHQAACNDPEVWLIYAVGQSIVLCGALVHKITCLFNAALFVSTSAAWPARAIAADTIQVPPPPTVLEARLILDADSCPAAVEVWVMGAQDTVHALELGVGWDRPDFARFTTERVDAGSPVALNKGPAGDTVQPRVKETRSVIRPAMQRKGGLLEDWEFAEARGESGLRIKVVAFAYLTKEATARQCRRACPTLGETSWKSRF